jgi:sugar phosphate isomerase/epimerase
MTGTTKTGWPWRLGTSSYILPDDIIPNVRYLADKVDDVELVLFESREASNLPSASVVDELSRIARDSDLTYTVHFPLDVFPGSADEAERLKALDMFERIVDLTRNLEPFGYVLHLTPERYGACPSDDVPRWLDSLDRTLETLLVSGVVEPKSLCAETLSYPFEIVLPIVRKYDLSVTLDIGHVWLMDYDAPVACETLLDRTRICHLHGVSSPASAGGKDHLGLGVTDRGALEAFLTAFADRIETDGKTRVLTLEVFSLEHLENSLSILQQCRGILR